jgi:hypothetical protein
VSESSIAGNRRLSADGLDATTPETIDGETGKLLPTPRTINLSNLRDARLELAHVYREIDAGRIKSQDGTRRAYVLRIIHDVIVSAEFERRIVELEEKHEQRMQEAAGPALPYQH